MTHREKHNIESNCVSYNDDCYNETNSYADNVKAKLSMVKQNNNGRSNNV